MKNRKLLLIVSLLLALTVSLGGTLAYLTDTDEAVNVMTLGNVKIEQIELQRAEDVKHTSELGEGDLVPFKQGQPLYPAYPAKTGAYTAEPNDLLYWGPYVTAENAGNGLWDDEKLVGALDKFVFVKNTGTSDAYYRTWFAFECPEGIEFSDGSDKELMMNVNGSELFDWKKVGYDTIDGVRYLVMVATYQKALSAGEISRPSLLQVVLTHNADSEDMEKLGPTYEILAFTQAVQTENMPENAETALNAAFGSGHPWTAIPVVVTEIGITEAGEYNIAGNITTIDTGYIHTQNATGNVTINGNGNTITGTATSVDAFSWEGGTIPVMSPILSSANGSTVTVNDLTFTGTMSAVMAGHYQNATYNNYKTEFNNVNIVNADVVSFSSNISPALVVYGTLTMNNCNVYGTKLSKLETAPQWPVYDMAVVNYSDTTINDSKIGSIYVWNQAKVTVADGTEVDSIVVLGNMNTTKYGITIKAGATVGSIDLSAITDKNRINITIEDGATVDEIVDNEVSYPSIAAWQDAQ